MAKIHKGELEIENGLGLPKKTSTQIANTVQPDGYLVFNTDTDDVEIRRGGLSKKVAFAEDVTSTNGAKVDKAGDVMTGTLVINTANLELESAAAGTESRLIFSTDNVDMGFLGEDAGKISLKSTNRDLALFAGTADLTVSAANVSLTGTALSVNTTATFTGEVSVPTPTNAANPVTLGYFQANSSYTLAGLTDTTIGTLATGQSLFWNGSAWVNRVAVLADISDFDATAYATGAEGDLAATALQDITGEVIGDLSDVDTTTVAPTSGQALVFDSGAWKPSTLTGGSDRVLRAGDTMTGTLNFATAGAGISVDGQTDSTTLVEVTNGARLVLDGAQARFNNSPVLLTDSSIVGFGMTGIYIDGGSISDVESTPRVDIDYDGVKLTSGADLTFVGAGFGNKVGMEWKDTAGTSTLAQISVDDTDGTSFKLEYGANRFKMGSSFIQSNTLVSYNGGNATNIAAIDGAVDSVLVTKEWVAAQVGAVSGSAVTNLDGLSDVVLTNEVDGHGLFHDGTSWVNRVATKADISDFIEGDYATAAQGTKADSALQDLTGSSIGSLSDVDTTGIAEGDFLVYNASGEFVPGQVADTDLTNYVTLDGDETITGEKTFSGNVILPAGSNLDIGPVQTVPVTDGTVSSVSTTIVEHLDGLVKFSVDSAYLSVEPQGVEMSSGTGLSRVIMDQKSVTISTPNAGSLRLDGADDLNRVTSLLGGAGVSETMLSHVNGDVFQSTTLEIRGKAFDGISEVGTTLTTKDYVDNAVTTATGGAVTELNNLTDVTIAGNVAGHVLFSDGTDFANRAITEDDISDFGSYASFAHSHGKGDITDFEETDYVHTTGDESIAGDKTFDNNVAIAGNLTVGGTTTTVNSTNLDITDSIVKLNKGEVGPGVTAPSQSGLEIARGDADLNKFIIWSEANGKFGQADATAITDSDVNVATFEGFATEAYVDATHDKVSFVTGDWTTAAGVSTLVLAQGTDHNVVADDTYHVSVYEGTELVSIETNVSATGDVTLTTTGAVFAGRVRISL